MASYDLEEVATRMANNPATTTALPAGGAYLLLCALQSLQERYQWNYEGDELTDNQWDALQEDISLITERLMIDVGDGEMVSPGAVIAFVCDPGSGWLLCDGSQYDEVDYPELYAVLPGWLIQNEDSFWAPNLTGKIAVGSGGGFSAGGGGGEVLHLLNVSEMPVHAHSLDYQSTLVGGGGQPRVTGPYSQPTAVSTRNTGGGMPHNNMPPYLVLDWYIKT